MQRAGADGVGVVVLAAGRSTRMGGPNKLLADLDGKPIVRHTVEAALATRARPVIVVLGHQADAVRAALAGLDIIAVGNPDYATGLASSLKAGIRALPEGCTGALVLLGDMPRIGPAHLEALMAAHAPGRIVVPTHEGRRGNPVLWSAAFFPEMLQLDGDAGARRLMAAHAGAVQEVELATDAIFLDVDTPQALAELRGAGQDHG